METRISRKVDAYIAGFKAGPQEMPAWQREFFEEEQRAKEAAEKLARESGKS